ncbi:MAG: DEAD/DEAH box helicase family protein [Clostridia bacterium]|nr:DEAD/DEAH box helicase family protein [Clostridia bacterium]
MTRRFTDDDELLSLDWDEAFGNAPEDGGATEGSMSIEDAFIACLNRYASVDIEYISRLCGEDMRTVISALEGSGAIYQNPLKWEECYYLGYESADEYLSGNILEKLRAAKEANEKHGGYFERNITALKKVLPKKMHSDEIYVTIGSPWLPAEIIDQFIAHLLGKAAHASYYSKDYLRTKHDLATGSWEIPLKSRYDYGKSRTLSCFTFGTRFMNALEIIERTLNQRICTVYDTNTTRVGGKTKTTRTLNETESVLAQEKQKLILEEFAKWIFDSPKRKSAIEKIYNERYGCVVARQYSGAFLALPDINPRISLYTYQKNAIARILFSKNTLLAHDVGAGKTYIMVAAGHELRRMGVSKKNVYVVPNSLTGQWTDSYHELYPDAKLLTVTPAMFTPKRRDEALRLMRDGDFEAIIIPYSCFDRIPLSRDYLISELEEKKAEIDKALDDPKRVTSALKRRQHTLEEALKKAKGESTLPMLEAPKPAGLIGDGKSEGEDGESEDDCGIYFEDLGIGTLFLDEAHNYKNIKLETKMQILGVSETYSSKCENMLKKVHCVQRSNGGRGVIFATGTPITNSVSDVFTMQRYLQHGELELLELGAFDSWVGMFAEKQTEFEIDVDTSSFRMATRLSRFNNLPELTAIFASVTDFHKVDKTNEIPEFSGYTDVLVPKTADFAMYLEDISKRADMVRRHQVPRKQDNLLLITTDGRKAALDIRLVRPSVCFSTSSKVYKCAERVADVYFRTESERCAQLIFCDTSTPKAGFNVYDELRSLLVIMGVKNEEIEYVHNATTDTQRTKLFARVNKGEIRVLIGSTFKVGMGVNVQERLVAMHHIDLPWRPSDVTQREGRILRQGNTCPSVEIYRYVTEGSFDAYSWQLLETKQRFIEDILSGFVTDRSAEDVGEMSLNYGEIKALAIGNPLIKERIECANMLTKFKLLMSRDAEERESLSGELASIPQKKARQARLIAACEHDLEYLTAEGEDSLTKEEKNGFRDIISEALRDGELLTEERTVTCYRGFDIVIPAGMMRSAPYIFLVRDGRYFLELGESDKGIIIRIDNKLDSLPKHLEMLKAADAELKRRERGIKSELKKSNNYQERIEYYKARLTELDQKLGVK